MALQGVYTSTYTLTTDASGDASLTTTDTNAHWIDRIELSGKTLATGATLSITDAETGATIFSQTTVADGIYPVRVQAKSTAGANVSGHFVALSVQGGLTITIASGGNAKVLVVRIIRSDTKPI